MNLLFLTLVKTDIEQRGIYNDLMRQFAKEGHQVYIMFPTERREKGKTEMVSHDNVHYIKVKTLNIQKTNIIEKGLATLAIEYQFLSAVKSQLNKVKFDTILYTTPPITFTKVIDFVKKRDQAKSYLLLKDIFPQNAVDLGMMKKNGFLHQFFSKKEKQLYQVSDTIGCMSPANVSFLLKHHPYLSPKKVEVNPNTIEPIPYQEITEDKKQKIRQKYNIPNGVQLFIYGGNLGKPQGLSFLKDTLLAQKNNQKAYFLVVGSGTELVDMQSFFKENKLANAQLYEFLPKKEYDDLVSVADVGLIFLNRNFSIPNFPSRMLSYLENALPMIAATDANTDIGSVIENNHCGFYVLSGDLQSMNEKIQWFCDNNHQSMKKNALQLLENDYLIDKTYQLIIEK